MVGVREVLESEEFNNFNFFFVMGFGKDVVGKIIIGDIGKMLYLLIVGFIGLGKSVCVNILISSILYKVNFDEVKLLLIDLKVVEFVNYNGILYLLILVVIDFKKVVNVLNWVVIEMNRRYKLFVDV